VDYLHTNSKFLNPKQWAKGEKGEMEWITAEEADKREEERRKYIEAVQRARDSEKNQRVNHEQRVRAEIAAAPKRAEHLDTLGARATLELTSEEKEQKKSKLGALALFARKKNGSETARMQFKQVGLQNIGNDSFVWICL